MAQTDPEPEQEATILVLRDDNGQFGAVTEAGAEQREQAKAEALNRRAIFEHRAKGAQARAGMLPRSLTAALAGGTVNLMLAKLLQEEIVPGSAKEAADVAKVAHEILMKASGAANPKDLTPAERQQKQDDVTALEAKLIERAHSAAAVLGGALPEGVTPDDAGEGDEPDDDVEPEVWEHESVRDDD